jgi:hypothetical protein
MAVRNTNDFADTSVVTARKFIAGLTDFFLLFITEATLTDKQTILLMSVGVRRF